MIIQKPIGHNTTYGYIDHLSLCFHTLFNRLPIMRVTGTFTDLKTKELVFVNMKEVEVLRQRKTGNAVYVMTVDGEEIKAMIEDEEQKNIICFN